MQLFVRSLAEGSLVVDGEPSWKVETLKRWVEETCGVPAPLQRLVFSRRELDDSCELRECGLAHGDIVTLALRLRGGKGGFGALLRGQGRDGKITTNYDACRDLSGRRLRHINAEKKLDDWSKESKERDLEQVALQHLKEKSKEERRAKREEVDVGEVLLQRQSTISGVKTAVQQALKTGANVMGGKRKHDGPCPASRPKKSRLAFLDEDDLSSESDDNEIEDEIMLEATQPAPVGSPEGNEIAGSNDSHAERIDLSSVEDSKRVGVSLDRSASECHEMDLSKFQDSKSLEAVGLDALKLELKRRGLICGGSLAQRAARLFMLKDTPMHAIDKKYLAKQA
ncbi:hypothetical protein BSKO_08190 [Bryopsis sp. KO-2023]|nr:hypothetical protein BSKO_08190 [Bryopsis sp. KO-2023]